MLFLMSLLDDKTAHHRALQRTPAQYYSITIILAIG